MNKPPGSLYLEGRFNGGFFALRVWPGLRKSFVIVRTSFYRGSTVTQMQAPLSDIQNLPSPSPRVCTDEVRSSHLTRK